jgi:3-oxoacyl-[acyl-carrier protein] reductase
MVTGGSRGIGAAIVRRLACDGCAVAFTYASSEAQAQDLQSSLEKSGLRCLALKADSASPEQLQAAVQEARDTLGPLDIFVNNAGILSVGLIDEFALDELDRLLNVNVRAVYIGIQAAVKAMRDGGRVITIGSSAANRIAFPGISAYSMTKAALQGLVRGLASDLAPRAITVNNVQPGPIGTEINPHDGPTADLLKNMILLKRYGTEEEVASLVGYLCTPEASFVTGASLTVDGGFGI